MSTLALESKPEVAKLILAGALPLARASHLVSECSGVGCVLSSLVRFHVRASRGFFSSLHKAPHKAPGGTIIF